MPLYEVRCQSCDRQYERIRTIEERKDPCDHCGGEVEQIYGYTWQQKGFEPYFDTGLGIWASTKGDINQALRRAGADHREPMSKGDLSARRDQIRERARRTNA